MNVGKKITCEANDRKQGLWNMWFCFMCPFVLNNFLFIKKMKEYQWMKIQVDFIVWTCCLGCPNNVGSCVHVN
jgi:hypothetical protein